MISIMLLVFRPVAIGIWGGTMGPPIDSGIYNKEWVWLLPFKKTALEPELGSRNRPAWTPNITVNTYTLGGL